MQYICPYCEKKLTENDIFQGTCPNCKKIIDFSIVKKNQQKDSSTLKKIQLSPQESKSTPEKTQGTGESNKLQPVNPRAKLKFALKTGFGGIKMWLYIAGFVLIWNPLGWILLSGLLLWSLASGWQACSKLNRLFSISCPYCAHTFLYDSSQPGVNCPACQKRIVVHGKTYSRAEDQMKQEQNSKSQLIKTELDEIEKLASLKEKGIITQEEFEAKKKKLLGIE